MFHVLIKKVRTSLILVGKVYLYFCTSRFIVQGSTSSVTAQFHPSLQYTGLAMNVGKKIQINVQTKQYHGFIKVDGLQKIPEMLFPLTYTNEVGDQWSQRPTALRVFGISDNLKFFFHERLKPQVIPLPLEGAAQTIGHSIATGRLNTQYLSVCCR